MADIFLSYKSEDRERVEPLARTLVEHGYSIWWDTGIQPGQEWTKRIKTELDSAKCVLVVWSAASIADNGTYVSHHVENEASEGARRRILIPVLLDEERLAWTHQHIQHTSLADWLGESAHPGVSKLVAAIETIAGVAAVPPKDELVAWRHVEQARTEDALDHFIRTFPQSKFASLASLRLSVLRSSRLERQLTALVEDPNASDHMWLEHATAILTSIRNALSERLDDIELDLEDQERKENPNEVAVSKAHDDLLLYAGLLDALEQLKSECARIDGLLDLADRLSSDE